MVAVIDGGRISLAFGFEIGAKKALNTTRSTTDLILFVFRKTTETKLSKVGARLFVQQQASRSPGTLRSSSATVR